MVTLENIIKRTCRGRIILFGILTAYSGFLALFMLVMSINDGNMSMIGPSCIFIALTLVCLYFFIQPIRIWRDYRRHKSMKKLTASGLGSAESIAQLINFELASIIRFSCRGKTFITQNWVIAGVLLSIRIKPIEELIWAYKLVTKSNIGTKYYHAVLIFSDRTKIKATVGTESDIDSLLGYIDQNLIHVLVGFNQGLSDMYNARYNMFVETIIQSEQERRASRGKELIDVDAKRAMLLGKK